MGVVNDSQIPDVIREKSVIMKHPIHNLAGTDIACFYWKYHSMEVNSDIFILASSNINY